MRRRCETILPPPLDPSEPDEEPTSGAYAYACIGVLAAWTSPGDDEEAPDTEREGLFALDVDHRDTSPASAPIWDRDTLADLDPESLSFGPPGPV